MTDSTVYQFKVCLLGAPAVGKTSLVKRFVQSIFSERYQSTIGVKIDRKNLSIGSSTITLAIWDLNGEHHFDRMRSSYLRAMKGFLLVVDGTRPDTLLAAEDLLTGALETVPNTPFVTCFNKSDLVDDWKVDEAEFGSKHANSDSLRTSAKADTEVETAFTMLCQKMLANV